MDKRDKRAIKLQAEITNKTAELNELGFRIEVKYIENAGWVSEIVNRNNGENHEISLQEMIDAQQEKNRDYALDNNRRFETKGVWTSAQSLRDENE